MKYKYLISVIVVVRTSYVVILYAWRTILKLSLK